MGDWGVCEGARRVYLAESLAGSGALLIVMGPDHAQTDDEPLWEVVMAGRVV